MPIRNRWKLGDWLVIDEESGITRYASEVTKDCDGKLVTKRYADTRNPQEFVKALRDPAPVPFSNGGSRRFEVCNHPSYYIGNTTIKTPPGPAQARFAQGIGQMQIGCSFIVE